MQTKYFPTGGSPAPQFDRERSALKDALVEFFSHSKGSSRILRLLSAKREPIGYKALMDEIRYDEKSSSDHQELPASAIRAVLCITQAAGLVRLTRHGFSITEVGREVHRRLWLRRARQHVGISPVTSTTGNGCLSPATTAMSRRPRLREAREEALLTVPR